MNYSTIPKNRYSFSCNPHLENNVPWTLTKEEWLVKFREAMILKNVNSIFLVNQLNVSPIVADSIVSNLENLRNKRRVNSLKVRKERSTEAKLQFKALYENGYSIKEISAKLGYSIRWCFNTKKELSIITLTKAKRNKLNSLQKNNSSLIYKSISYFTKCTNNLHASFSAIDNDTLILLINKRNLCFYNNMELEALYDILIARNEKLYAARVKDWYLFGKSYDLTDEQEYLLSIEEWI